MVWDRQKAIPKPPEEKKQQVLEQKTNVAQAIAQSKTPSQQIALAGGMIDTSNLNDIATRYNDGDIGKGQATLEIYKAQNRQPQDFYGKVIDQFGAPIAGVDVTGSIVVMGGLGDGASNQTYTTQSDSAGLFEFTRKTGWKFNVVVKKNGYYMGQRGEGYQSQIGSSTQPTDRAILKMWQLRGPEPLVSSSFETKIPYDGTPVTISTAAQKIDPNGDFRVTLLRSPLEVRRSGQLFDWALRIEMLQGGLVAEGDPYPFWAPSDGYEQSFETNINTNNVPWNSTISQDFYIKNATGQYGRMRVNVYSALTPAKIKFEFWINPSGSHNLEPEVPN